MDFNISELVKDITKEIRRAEKIFLTINPPKPERESTRQKKKPINADFIDYSRKNLGCFNKVS
jgi:hypothetical protein